VCTAKKGVLRESSALLGNIVPGVFTPVLAKHSKSFNLIDTFAVGVDRIQRNFEPMRRQDTDGFVPKKAKKETGEPKIGCERSQRNVVNGQRYFDAAVDWTNCSGTSATAAGSARMNALLKPLLIGDPLEKTGEFALLFFRLAAPAAAQNPCREARVPFALNLI